MSRSSLRALFAAIVTSAGMLASPALAALSVDVDTPRALSALADELEKRYAIVVTYEDCPWVHPSDVEESHAEGVRPGVLIPRTAAVSFHYDAPADHSSVAVSDVLSAFLIQYHSAGAPGMFHLEGSNGLYHLVPSQRKDADGNWRPVSSPLETRIHLADRERTLNDTFDEIMSQLNQSSPIAIVWGFAPLNLFVQKRLRIAADGESARDVMRRIVEQLMPSRITWRLNYDPLTKRYYLNILVPSYGVKTAPAR